MQYIPLNLIVNELSQLSSACLNGYELYFINFVEYTMTASLVPNNVIF